MLFYRSLIALTLFASTASGLDLLIKSVRCESRQVQVKFDYICNGDSLCTFGEIESMEGACKSINQSINQKQTSS